MRKSFSIDLVSIDLVSVPNQISGSLLAASETCDASRRASRVSPSGTSRDPSLVTINPHVVASYADERRAEKKDEPRARAGDPTDPATVANQVIAPIPEI